MPVARQCRLHQAGAAGRQAHRAARLQRRSPAAFRGPRDLHRIYFAHETDVININLLHLASRRSCFCGTECLTSGVASEGRRRGLSWNRIAELTSCNAARRFGLIRKGDIVPGYDADLVPFDPGKSFVVRAADSESTQGYTPFEGMEPTGKVVTTYLRGEVTCHKGKVVGPARGQYLARPC